MDYEGRDALLSPYQIQVILENITHPLVLTIAGRASEFNPNSQLLDAFLELMGFPNLAFCVVAGHPAYASIDQKVSSIEGCERTKIMSTFEPKKMPSTKKNVHFCQN